MQHISKKVIIMIVALSLMTIANAKGHKGHKKGIMNPKVMEQLDLSAEQKTKFDKYFANHKKEMKANKGELRDARKSLQTAFESPTVDKVKIKAAKEAILKAETKMIDAKVNSMTFVSENLTKDQRVKMAELRKEFMKNYKCGACKKAGKGKHCDDCKKNMKTCEACEKAGEKCDNCKKHGKKDGKKKGKHCDKASTI